MASLLRRSQDELGLNESAPVDVRMRRRFARRQWRRRWHVWRVVLAVVIVVGLCAAAVWAIYFSTVLSVKAVQVKGVDLLTAQQVRVAAKVPVGEPLATLGLAEIDARVNAMAPVRSVQVTRRWPDQVLIEVQEREVVAVVVLGTQFRGMDETGVLFRDYQRPPRQVPRIRTDLNVDTDTLREAGEVLSALPESVSSRVSFLSVETIDRISLSLRDGRTVLWGSAEDSADKAKVLEKLLGIRARSYDVSVPGLPTYRQ